MLNNLGQRDLQKGYTKRQKQAWLNEFADWQLMTQQLAAELSPLIAAVVLSTARQAYIDLGMDSADFDAAIAAVEAYPADRSAKVALAINEETNKQLRATLMQGTDAGESTDELRARIERVFGAALTYRAARTAQTEIVGGQGFGDVAAWKQSGRVEAKEWYTAEDELVCPFCSAMDGIIKPLDDAYFEQGDSITAGGEKMTVGFGDIHWPPLHVSCRCYLLEVLI